MAKNDVVVRTPQDLERKYNFASLLGLKKNVEITAQGIQKIENELNSMLNALVINLKDVLDSQSEISLWFYSGKPTTSNEPYTLWQNPKDHIGDIYYDQKTGVVYQWNGLWEVNTSPDLVEAMAITNAETDTSEDHERKVFFDTPTIPYSSGDWWIKEDGSLFICQISKTSGEYETADFINSSDYTESFAEKVGEELKVLKGTITIISENYAKFTDLATGGSTIISGDNIVTGNIKSQNYIENTSGTKINLTDGTIDTKGFKVDATGNMTCNNAIVKGSAILNGNNFEVDTSGNMTCANANITGGSVSLKGTFQQGKVMITSTDTNHYSSIAAGEYVIRRGDTNNQFYLSGYNTNDWLMQIRPSANESISLTAGSTLGTSINVGNSSTSQYTNIYASGIYTPALTQTSREEVKKNIELFTDGLKVIKNTDIYKYHLKAQTDDDKKHIGFVIGEKYNYSNEITALDNNKKEVGVDIYSMVAVTFKAIQEQQEEIEKLKNEISKLKEVS